MLTTVPVNSFPQYFIVNDIFVVVYFRFQNILCPLNIKIKKTPTFNDMSVKPDGARVRRFTDMSVRSSFFYEVVFCPRKKITAITAPGSFAIAADTIAFYQGQILEYIAYITYICKSRKLLGATQLNHCL